MPVKQPNTLTLMKRHEYFATLPEELIVDHTKNGRTFGRFTNNIESIKELGQIHPVIVTRNGPSWEVVVGYGRVEDIKQINIERVAAGQEPMLVKCVLQDVNPEQAFILNIAENKGRSEVSCIDTAFNIQKLQAVFGKTDEEVITIYEGARKKVDAHWLDSHRKLLTLSKDVQKKIHQKELSHEIGVKLADLTEEERNAVLETIATITGKVSGTKVDEAVRATRRESGNAEANTTAYTLKGLKKAVEWMNSKECDLPKSARRIMIGVKDLVEGAIPEPEFLALLRRHVKPDAEKAKA